MKKAIIINEKDTVAVALTDLECGEELFGVSILTKIPKGHKFALCDIKSGETVLKYGNSIGVAKKDIKKGDRIHTENLKTNIKENEKYEFSTDYPYYKDSSPYTFWGYKRKNGKIGIRNSLLIIATVGCANKTCELIKKASEEVVDIPDGIHLFTHPYGCSQLGDDAENTAKCISGLINNANFGGTLLVSLGCENNNLSFMEDYLKDCDKDRLLTLVTQESGNEIADGVALVQKLALKMSRDERTEQPISELTIGFKCGGSDSFSGITANPLCGYLTDYFVKSEAKVILTEVPEMFGAEKQLFERCVNEEVFSKAVKMVESFKQYFISHGSVVYENPSPGNKDGGITTLEEKSSGCVTKGGTAPVTDVLGLYEKCERKGLSLLWGPGNDIVSTTNLAVAGAVLILFTTGRGTPLGAPVPTIKISSNTSLYNKKREWIDFDAGEILDGVSFKDASLKLLKKVIAVSNGESTKNEIAGYEEIAIFKDGVTL